MRPPIISRIPAAVWVLLRVLMFLVERGSDEEEKGDEEGECGFHFVGLCVVPNRFE
jgi:hypothetical protein